MTRVWIFPGGTISNKAIVFMGEWPGGGVMDVKSLVASTWQVPRGTPKWLLVHHLDLFVNWSLTRSDDRGQRPYSVARNSHYLLFVESIRIFYQQWPSSRVDSAPSAEWKPPNLAANFTFTFNWKTATRVYYFINLMSVKFAKNKNEGIGENVFKRNDMA